MPLLSLSTPPAVYPVALRGMTRNTDGLYSADAIMEHLDNSIAAFDAIFLFFTKLPGAI